MNKVPKDPDYSLEYPYSVTNNGREYQISTIQKGSSSEEPNILDSSYAATSAKAYVSGNYNGLYATTNANSTAYYLAVPSLLLATVAQTDLATITNQDVWVVNGQTNLPATYASSPSLSLTGASITFAPTVVFSSATSKYPSTDTDYQNFAANLQTAYSGSAIIKSLPNVQILVNSSGTAALVNLARSSVATSIASKSDAITIISGGTASVNTGGGGTTSTGYPGCDTADITLGNGQIWAACNVGASKAYT